MDCLKCVLCNLSVVTFTYPVRVPWFLTSCVVSGDVSGVANIVPPYHTNRRSDFFSLLKKKGNLIFLSAKLTTLCYRNFYSAYGKRLEMWNIPYYTWPCDREREGKFDVILTVHRL